ncbi:MAG: PAS and helix-turn-helix domain-containing protein [Bacteriovoracaceae bacterium]|nr:PAS and helix-turn-helix domain-containing protein [Bacteriovoracaceae bacterium]
MSKQQLIELIEQLKLQVDQQNVLEEELMQIFNTAADGMRVIDIDFNTLRVNETFLKLSNSTLSQNIGQKCHDVFKGAFCHTDKCPILQIKSGKEKFEAEVEKIRTDGSIVPCIVSATRFTDSSGKLIGVVEDFKDISERKISEEKIKSKNIKLKEANITLRNVLAHIEEEKISIKENINLNIEKTVKPVLQKIKEGGHNKAQLLELLETNLNRLSMDFYHKINNYKLKLSPTEIKVCQLVRAGYQAKEIASLMHIATSTVHVHKEKIRRKLGLTNKPINLKTYLSELLNQ